jgi:predicted hotdog family 3-hydroxylacyl-ACP dehydratase
VSEFPPIRELLPHGGPMALLDRVIEHDEDSTTCGIVIADQALLRDPDGSVPVWIGIEYLAQCIGVHAALVRRSQGHAEAPQGFLVGGRRLHFRVDRFEPAQRLEATAKRRWGGSSQSLISFECELRDARDGRVLAEGRLNCFLVPVGGKLEPA